MARAIRWTVPFMSLNGTSCRVDIYDEGFTGDATTLTGAANAFEYSEIDDEDLLNMVIRYRTGYLRLIEEERGELDAIRPSVNTDRYIEFFYGDTLDFNGFIQAQSFDNEWVGGKRVLSLPVISPIGLAVGTDFPWTDSDDPTQYNIHTIMNKALTSLQAGYTGFVFPQYMETPSSYTLVATSLYLNSLVFAPFSDSYNKNYSPSEQNPIYAPKTVEDALTVLCTGFGLILHDVPETPIFQRMDYKGNYVTFGFVSPASQITPGISSLPLIASVSGADNSESVVMPLSKVEVTYAGNKDIPEMSMSRCKGYSRGCAIPDNEFCTNLPNISDFDGNFTEAVSIDSDGLIDEGKICLGAYGSGSLGEMILYRVSVSWGNGYKIGSYTFFEYFGESVRLTFKHLYGESIENLDNPPYYSDYCDIGVVVKMGSMYYSLQSGWQPIPISLTYTKVWNDGSVDCEVDILPNYYITPQPLTIEFYAVSYNPSLFIQEITDVKLENYLSATSAYLNKNVDQNSYKIDGSPSDISGSITRGCSILAKTTNRLRFNSNVIDGTAEVEIIDLEPKYPYLLIAQERLQVSMKMAYQTPATLYLNRLQVWGSSGMWRTVAHGFQPWNDLHRFTLHHSSIFDYE